MNNNVRFRVRSEVFIYVYGAQFQSFFGENCQATTFCSAKNCQIKSKIKDIEYEDCQVLNFKTQNYNFTCPDYNNDGLLSYCEEEFEAGISESDILIKNWPKTEFGKFAKIACRGHGFAIRYCGSSTPGNNWSDHVDFSGCYSVKMNDIILSPKTSGDIFLILERLESKISLLVNRKAPSQIIRKTEKRTILDESFEVINFSDLFNIITEIDQVLNSQTAWSQIKDKTVSTTTILKYLKIMKTAAFEAYIEELPFNDQKFVGEIITLEFRKDFLGKAQIR